MGKKIAITGGIGSGKSYVAEYIKGLGFSVFSCDEIYKEISQGKAYVQKIQSVFPDCVNEGRIDRKKLAQTVFSDEKQLKKLNALSHPLIMEKLYEEMDNAEGNLIFAEVPLLFEGGFEKDFHETIYVKRNLRERIQGVIQRDTISEREVLGRIYNQCSLECVEAKIKEEGILIHFIPNDGSLEELNAKIDEAIEDLSR